MSERLLNTRNLLLLVAVLLAANLAVALFREEQPPMPPYRVLPEARAGEVLKLEGQILITTNEHGDRLTVWKLGRYVGDKYESIDSNSYFADISR
ncbi:hypothetical protein KQI84_15960 [bacterium]|nr:hypothetical protein [bacterium]